MDHNECNQLYTILNDNNNNIETTFNMYQTVLYCTVFDRIASIARDMSTQSVLLRTTTLNRLIKRIIAEDNSRKVKKTNHRNVKQKIPLRRRRK